MGLTSTSNQQIHTVFTYHINWKQFTENFIDNTVIIKPSNSQNAS